MLLIPTKGSEAIVEERLLNAGVPLIRATIGDHIVFEVDEKYYATIQATTPGLGYLLVVHELITAVLKCLETL